MRCNIIERMSALLREPATMERFAAVESVDCGKPVEEARGDIGFCADVLEYYARAARPSDEGGAGALDPHDVGSASPDGFRGTVAHEPAGVVACVTPWNFPLMQAVLKVAPALAAGCSVVLKPSPLASMTCALFAALARDAGLPDGALALLTGGPCASTGDAAGRAGADLSAHPGIDRLSFTGSGAGGSAVLSAAAPLLRPTGLELGGKGAMIVFADADMESAVDWALVGIFLCSGQVCSATSRLLVEETAYDAFVEAVVARASTIRMGHPLDNRTQMGPVVSAAQRDKVLAAVARAESEGCRALLGGSSAQSPCADENIGPTAPSPDGFFVAPTVLDRTPLDCAAWREEIFGPVLCCRPFADEGEAVAVANETPYGLGDAVFSADEVRAARVAARLTSGVVWTNCNQALWPATPFGGRKQSGFGWELGEAGLEEYTQRKTLIAAPSGASWGAYA
jgi:betaine-aldehyde dehydrogenase